MKDWMSKKLVEMLDAFPNSLEPADIVAFLKKGSRYVHGIAFSDMIIECKDGSMMVLKDTDHGIEMSAIAPKLDDGNAGHA
jgi:hypothetical protein